MRRYSVSEIFASALVGMSQRSDQIVIPAPPIDLGKHTFVCSGLSTTSNTTNNQVRENVNLESKSCVRRRRIRITFLDLKSKLEVVLQQEEEEDRLNESD